MQMFRDRYVPLQEILYTYADRYDVQATDIDRNTSTAMDSNEFSDLAVPDEADIFELTPEQRQLEAARRYQVVGGGGGTGENPSLRRSHTT